MVASLDPALAHVVPQVSALLSIGQGDHAGSPADAEMRKLRRLAAVKRLLLRESLNGPLVLMLEDLHWYDEGSIALVNMLADGIASAPVVMLVNYRPEFRHEWGNKSYYTQASLSPLADRSAEEMLSALLGEGVQLEPLRRLIIEKTDGNPFFIEEVVQTLFEQGVLARNGAVSLVRPIVDLSIPATVQGILASRIDRLDPAEKDVLQTAAVIGKFFTCNVLGEVIAQPAAELERRLRNLELAEFIYE